MYIIVSGGGLHRIPPSPTQSYIIVGQYTYHHMLYSVECLPRCPLHINQLIPYPFYYSCLYPCSISYSLLQGLVTDAKENSKQTADVLEEDKLQTW